MYMLTEHHEYHDLNERGRMERVEYTTTDKEGKICPKYANVYLPFGYDETDSEKKYNVFYILHGGGGNADAFLDCCPTKNMIDELITKKKMEPTVFVFPSYYKEPIERVGGPNTALENFNVLFFQEELVKELLPAVEKKYHVYADREHRGFSGFSMGGGATWYALMKNLAYFKYFAPLSGDCWVIDVKGGKQYAKETTEAIVATIKESGYGKEDYKIYAATGTEDIAYENLTPQIDAMKEEKDFFEYSDQLDEGNFHYLVEEGAWHSYDCVYHYLYHILPHLFR